MGSRTTILFNCGDVGDSREPFLKQQRKYKGTSNRVSFQMGWCAIDHKTTPGNQCVYPISKLTHRRNPLTLLLNKQLAIVRQQTHALKNIIFLFSDQWHFYGLKGNSLAKSWLRSAFFEYLNSNIRNGRNHRWRYSSIHTITETHTGLKGDFKDGKNHTNSNH